MKKFLTLFILAITLMTSAWAEDATWSFTWNTSRSDGGEGFYHISSNDDTIQIATLNTLEWVFQGNTSVTAYTGSAGQYFGSAKSPVKHATLSTSRLHGVIKKVSIEAKKKDGTEVTLKVSVNGVQYICNEQYTENLTTDFEAHDFIPLAEAADGEIIIGMDQPSETTGPIYFRSMTIVYEGEGVDVPVVEKKDPELEYAVKTVTVENGDNAYANYLINPYKVSPITYVSGDEALAHVNSNGDIITTGTKTGSTTVTAYFAGNDEYLPDTAAYTLVVVEKPIIAAPELSHASGTYYEAFELTISSSDTLAKAIWYSTTAIDSAALIDKPNIVPYTTATITISKSCKLYCCAVGYNNIGCVAVAEYKITEAPVVPQIAVGFPAESYLSPDGAAFLPLQVPVTFNGISASEAEEWEWVFEGTDTPSSTDQNPTVTYTQAGRYSLSLSASNQAGASKVVIENGIVAGGAADIWNLEVVESQDLDKISLGWYGNYAGSNWLGMEAFAEKFHAPAAQASIDKVGVYFCADITYSKPNAQITAAIYNANNEGLPNEELTKTSLKVSELSKNDLTVFEFEAPVEIEGDFFVVLSGFPNESNNDDVSVRCHRREYGERNSVYHLLQDEDKNYNPLDTYTWYANEDDPLTMAVTAHLKYTNVIDNIETLTAPNATEERFLLNGIRTNATKGLLIQNGKVTMVK